MPEFRDSSGKVVDPRIFPLEERIKEWKARGERVYDYVEGESLEDVEEWHTRFDITAEKEMGAMAREHINHSLTGEQSEILWYTVRRIYGAQILALRKELRRRSQPTLK